jgi:hypothetical protein
MHQALRAGGSEDERVEAFIEDALFNRHKAVVQQEAPF